jgi:hypothetical protein
MTGLAAGVSTLLPARFGLLPGAFLVTPKANTTDFPGQNGPQADGTQVVAGYRTATAADGIPQRSLGAVAVSDGWPEL